MKIRLIASALAAAAASLMTPGTLAAQGVKQTTFNLRPNPAVLSCLSDGSGTAPSASVTVTRGQFNDTLAITVHHVKPNLGFDLFTVQRSNLLSDGTPDPNFPTVFNKSFGLAWYQSDLQAGPLGNATTTIKTILLDQIFGFDPDVALGPTNSFHVGFWFDDPQAAKDCGFDPTKPTPFNGEHKAGPVAMISVPDAITKLGPLCTNPNFTTNPVSCNP